MGTLIVGSIVTIILAAIVVNLVKRKKAGKSMSCDCQCKGCPNSEACNKSGH